MKLTKRAIEAFRYEGDGKSRDVRWDAALPGFGLRIYPTERKAFVMGYRGQVLLLPCQEREIQRELFREQANTNQICLAPRDLHSTTALGQ
jgi:hypothetical protein